MAEPLSDFEKPIALLVQRRSDGYSSLQRVESKTAALIAGTLVAIGLVLTRGGSILDSLLAIGFLRPLWLLFQAFHPVTYSGVPDGTELKAKWPIFPKTTMAVIFDAMIRAVDIQASSTEAKAMHLKGALQWLFWWSAFVIVVRTAETAMITYGAYPAFVAPLIGATSAPLPSPTPSLAPSPNPTRSFAPASPLAKPH